MLVKKPCLLKEYQPTNLAVFFFSSPKHLCLKFIYFFLLLYTFVLSKYRREVDCIGC